MISYISSGSINKYLAFIIIVIDWNIFSTITNDVYDTIRITSCGYSFCYNGNDNKC